MMCDSYQPDRAASTDDLQLLFNDVHGEWKLWEKQVTEGARHSSHRTSDTFTKLNISPIKKRHLEESGRLAQCNTSLEACAVNNIQKGQIAH